MKLLIVLSCIFAVVTASSLYSGDDDTCRLCIDFVTALDAFLTDDPTQEDIIKFIEQVRKHVLLY